MKVDFNAGILSSLVDQDPERANALYTKFPKVKDWLREDDRPTYNQLTSIANLFNIPFGYFFLRDFPEKEYPIPHFRTQDNMTFRPSKELTDTLETLQERQQWARDILIELQGEKLYFANSVTSHDSVEDTANKVKELLKLNEFWANSIPSWIEAFRLLIEKTEQAGIFVVVNGVVNNNTKRKLNVHEFRGFVLYDNYAPFVFINNNDSISGKIFTLIHEIVHVLIGKSASFDLRQLQPAADITEEYCDKVAAELLVPQIQLMEQIKTVGIDYQELARIFKVSQIVIARRLKDINKITLQEFFSFYDEYINTDRKIKNSKGGNFYNTAPYRISKKFFKLINNSVNQNKILYMDAFRLTGLKPKTYDEFVRKNQA